MKKRPASAVGSSNGASEQCRLLDDYTLSVRLGGGADGNVWRGLVRRGPQRGQVHAVKRFCHDAYDAETEMRMLKRAQSHPNVLTLLAVVREAGSHTVAIATPEMDMDLASFKERRRLDIGAQLADNFCRQMLAGVQHLHSLHIAHRDLKPANILLRIEADGVRLQLADFSRAREVPRVVTKLEPEAEGCDATPVELHPRVEMTAGLATPHYSAPECAFGNNRCMANTSQDMWAVGAVAFELRGPEYFAYGLDDTARWRCVVARIGPPPRGVKLGPRQDVHLAPAQRARDSAPEKALERVGEHWEERYVLLVRSTCEWIPERRRSATEALSLLPVDAASTRIEPEAASTNNEPAPTQLDPPSSASGASETAAECFEARRRAALHRRVKDWMRQSAKTVAQAHPLMQSPPTRSGRGRTTCACSGHCNQPGHRRHKCQSREIVLGAKLCPLCICTVPGCVAPRLKSDFCSAHARVLNPQPPVLQCIVASRDWWHLMVPCDVLAFINLWPQIMEHPLLAFTAALLKEPTALVAWEGAGLGLTPEAPEAPGALPQRRSLTAHAFLESLLGVLQAVDGCPNPVEVEQLARGGAARLLGPRATCVMLGAAEQAESGGVRAFLLGKSQTRHVICPNAMDTLSKLIEAAEDEEAKADWLLVRSSTSAQDVSEAASRVFTHIATKVPGTLPRLEKYTYVRLHVVRKILLGRASCRNADTAFDWSSVGRDALADMGPDQRDWLSYFPEGWSAEDIGEFVLGSGAAGLFVPMLACLWSDAVRACATTPDRRYINTVHESEIRTAYFWQIHGIPPHPTTLMELGGTGIPVAASPSGRSSNEAAPSQCRSA